MTFSTLIPLYNNNDFLGLFGINMHFNDLVDMANRDGFNSIVLLNEDDSKKITHDLSYSKLFIDNCYVVNSNADKYLVRLLKENSLDSFCKNWDEDYKISEKSDHLISKYIIKNEFGESIATIFIFKTIETIDLGDLELIQKAHIIGSALLILVLAFMMNYSYLITNRYKPNSIFFLTFYSFCTF
jgi:hypothetical protein